MQKVTDILSQFQPISLSDMDAVQLLNRTDTKFVFAQAILPAILEALKEDYRILEIDGIRTNAYRSLYYDTPEFQFFFDHHNGKNNRMKIRAREYINSGLCFLEIKKKEKGRTIKSRIKIDKIPDELSAEQNAFITERTGQKINLKASLWNSFTRLTLVNKVAKERLTIDCNLGYQLGEHVGKYSNVVIAEVKQERVDRNTSIMQLMKSRGIRPFRISKYCMGIRMMKPSLKSNIFKAKELVIKKISDAAVV